MTTCRPEVFTHERTGFSVGLLAAVLFSLIGLAGCGGGGGGDSAVGTPTVPPPVAASGISLVAGAFGGEGSLDGAPGRLSFPRPLAFNSKDDFVNQRRWPLTYGPRALAVDNNGNVFVADTLNHTIRKITSTGVVTTVGGKAGVRGADAGSLPGLLNFPQGIVVDRAGNLYVTTEDAVVKIVP